MRDREFKALHSSLQHLVGSLILPVRLGGRYNILVGSNAIQQENNRGEFLIFRIYHKLFLIPPSTKTGLEKKPHSSNKYMLNQTILTVWRCKPIGSRFRNMSCSNRNQFATLGIYLRG
jgi:hypothetical protein